MIGVRRIGLTGGIGSGKSTVAGMWARLGAGVIDVDAISRSLTAHGGAALPAIAAAFGAEFVGAGALDRDRMRQLVFADAAAKARLEALLHPLIAVEALRQADAARAAAIVFDIPLLAESSSWRARVGRILVVDCPQRVQVRRVAARSGWTAEAVQRVIDSQATRAQRRSVADAVLNNDEMATLQALQAEVETLWRHWIGPT